MTTNPFYLLPIAASAWLVYAAHGRSDAQGRAFRAFVIAGVVTICTRTALVVLGPIDQGSVVAAALEGLRLAVLLIVFGAYNAVADPFGVLRLAPRRFHEAALSAALALSIAPRMIAAAGRVREAQTMRGIHVRGWQTLPALAVPVLETGMEEAVTLAESMDARGHGRGRRSRYRPEEWGAAAFAVVGAALTGLALFASRFADRSADLGMSTYPLSWPAVVPLMVVAAAAFAVPAVVPEP
jgi:energy-coupling factor transport system permease protein